MSYILEALKKSDSERRAGRSPELANAPSYIVEPDQGWGRIGFAAAAAGLLVVGVGIGWWRPWQGEALRPAPSVATTPGGLTTAQTVAPAAPVPVAPPITPSAAEREPVSVARIDSAATSGATNAPVAVAAAAFPEAAPAVLPEAPAPAVVLPVQRPKVVDRPNRPRAVAEAAPKKPAAAGAPAKATVVTTKASVPAAVAAPVPVARPAGEVVRIDELPASVRNTLPKVRVGGFAGGTDAQDRFAVINDRIIREGEEVSPGLRLEGVGADGVVMNYQGHRFRSTP